MYLVGDFSNREYFGRYREIKIKEHITRDELAKTKENLSFQVIDLDERKYFDPDKNAWIEIYHDL